MSQIVTQTRTKVLDVRVLEIEAIHHNPFDGLSGFIANDVALDNRLIRPTQTDRFEGLGGVGALKESLDERVFEHS